MIAPSHPRASTAHLSVYPTEFRVISPLARRRCLSAALVIASLVTSAALARETDARKYLRFVDNGPDHQLQTSVVHFENASGAKVDLIGAVHIADGPYYAGLNERFKAYDALLYEMVKPKGMAGIGKPATAPAVKAKPKAEGGGSWISMLQRFMKNQLDLDFQLDAVDYNAPNFVHADMDAETFLDRQAARGESMISLMLDQMLRELNKPANAAGGNAGGDMGMMDLIEALQSPDRARQLKLVLGRQFENMETSLDAMEGSVLLDERNVAAMKILKENLDAGKKHLGVFYGAAHLKGMEKILTDEMGFKQVGEPEWLVAWDLADKEARPAAKPIEPAEKSAQQPAMQP
jgi:hypothetical protein